jgi:hypothetical protein
MRRTRRERAAREEADSKRRATSPKPLTAAGKSARTLIPSTLQSALDPRPAQPAVLLPALLLRSRAERERWNERDRADRATVQPRSPDPALLRARRAPPQPTGLRRNIATPKPRRQLPRAAAGGTSRGLPTAELSADARRARSPRPAHNAPQHWRLPRRVHSNPQRCAPALVLARSPARARRLSEQPAQRGPRAHLAEAYPTPRARAEKARLNVPAPLR